MCCYGRVWQVQTGGPDGDLGSNEIKQGIERTTVIVDGSGVLYDPAGINAAELRRLAEGRQMIQEFDTDLLSASGFRVLIGENDVILPVPFLATCLIVYHVIDNCASSAAFVGKVATLSSLSLFLFLRSLLYACQSL